MNKFKRISILVLSVGIVVFIVAGVNLLAVQQQKRIDGLGSAAYLSNCKIQSLGNILGFQPRMTSFAGGDDCSTPSPLETRENISTGFLWFGISLAAIGATLTLQGREKFEAFATRISQTLSTSSGRDGSRSASKLRALAKLRSEGLITDDEFNEQKRRHLENL